MTNVFVSLLVLIVGFILLMKGADFFCRKEVLLLLQDFIFLH